MRNSLYLLFGLALILAGCGGQNTDQAAEAPVPVTIVQFNADAADYVGRTVEISGTVDHVCKHGGKRMFIMGDDPGDRVKIEAGGKVAAFDATLEGSEVRVVAVGRVQTIDAAYLDTWEKEVRTGSGGEGLHTGCSEEQELAEGEGHDHDHDHAEGEGHDHDHDHAEQDDHGAADLQRIAGLRKQLAESGRDQLAFYHLECVSFEEL